MTKPKSDPLLSRGVWCLVVGVFTSWLLGLGLLFILVAAICGFVGLFRQRALQSFALLVVSLFFGVFCTHLAAVTGIYAYNYYRAASPSEPAHVKFSPATPRK